MSVSVCLCLCLCLCLGVWVSGSLGVWFSGYEANWGTRFGVVEFWVSLLGRRAGVFGGTRRGGSPSGPRRIPDVHIGFQLIILNEFWRDSGEIFSDFRTVEEPRVRRRS